jgi:NAD(P)-dependent dehydrogenase (short-subunit alcohol dehydrogenase family)
MEGVVKTKRRVALVTGASSGIGRACAEQLASAGLKVYGMSRHPTRDHGRGALPMLALDVRHDDSVRACVDRVITETGRIDVLVNNAGIAMEGAVEETSLDEIRAVLETNFFGAVRMMRAVLPIMRRRRSGRIINMGSAAGFLPMPYSAAYCASKHALRGFSESLDHEVRRFGIRVSVIEPGFVKTDIVEHSPVAAAPFEPYISARSNPARAFRQQIARGVDPDVIARTVVEAATEEYPRLRYLPDGAACVVALFRAVLPSPLFDLAFREQFQMNED